MDIFKKLERIRKEILVFSLIAFLLVVMGFTVLALSQTAFQRTLLGVVSFAAFLLTLAMIRLRIIAYKRLYGQHMTEQILTLEYDDVFYDPKKAIDPSLIASTDMILMGNSFESSEFRSGRYHKIDMMMADVSLKNRVDNTVTTYFDGTWMVFTFPKAFAESLQIKEKSFMNAQKPQGENPELDRVSVGSDELTRFFKVYGESEASAERFLSATLEKAVITLNYELSGDLMFYFHRDRLHIACHGRHAHYDPPVLGRLYREEVERALLADCGVIKRFLDTLLSESALFAGEKDRTP